MKKGNLKKLIYSLIIILTGFICNAQVDPEYDIEHSPQDSSIMYTGIDTTYEHTEIKTIALSWFLNDLPTPLIYNFNFPLVTSFAGGIVDVSVDNSAELTDDQNLKGGILNGTKLTVGIENGNSDVIELGSLLGSDNQEVDNFDFDETTRVLEISLQNDVNSPHQTTIPLQDLAPYQTISGTAGWDKDESDDLSSADVQTLIDASQSSLNYWTKTGANVHYTGNVGINTSSPTELLHVVSTSSLGRIFSENTSPTGIGALQAQNDDGTYVSLRAYGSSHTGALFGQSTADNMYLFSSGNDLTVGTLTAHNLYFGTSNTRSFVVQPDRDVHFYQQVGIGADATGPERLRVNGSINALDARSSIILGNRGLGGFYNFYAGINAGSENSGSNYNTALGRSALQLLAGGDANVGVGYQAGLRCTTGSNNFFLGASSGIDATTANGCIYIGPSSGAGNNTDDRFFLSGVGTHLTPLMYGEFENRYLRIKSHLAISNQNNNTDLASITTEYNGVEWNFEHDEFNDLNLTTEGSSSFYLQAPLKMLESTLTPTTTNLTFAVWQANSLGVNHVVKQAQLGNNLFVSGDEINSKFIDPLASTWSASTTAAYSGTEAAIDFSEDIDVESNVLENGDNSLKFSNNGAYYFTLNVRGNVAVGGDGFYLKVTQEGTTIYDMPFRCWVGGDTKTLVGKFVVTSTTDDDIQFLIRRIGTSGTYQDAEVKFHRVGLGG